MGKGPVAVLTLLLAVATAACDDTGGAPAASCAGPSVEVSPATAAPGEEVRVRVRFLFADCYDTGQTGTPPARRDVPVTFTGDGRTVLLTTADAHADGTLDEPVRIPDDAAPGPAEIAVAGVAAEVTIGG